MTTDRNLTGASVGQATRRPSPRISLVLAFAGLIAVGLTQTGCRSDGCSTCGGFGSRLTNGVQSLSTRVFNHKSKGNCSTCGTLGTTTEEGVIVDPGIPIVTPGVVTVPPTTGVVPAPSSEPAPSQLEAIPGPATGSTNPTSSTRNAGGANRSAYEASNRKNLIASKRGSDLSRAYDPASPTPAAYAPEDTDVFDHLPPVDLPSDLSRKVTPINPAGGPAKDPTAPPDAAEPANQPEPRTTSAESNSAGDRAVLGRVAAKPGSLRATPGMAISASVAPAVAGGSLPSADGLAWLKEKGYRTLVDLRPRQEVDPAFPDLVGDSGMLYVALPFATDPINPARLARFNDLMGQNEQRPLYFCDGDGRRAGLLWYLRLRSQDREEANSARSKAEEIGLQASDLPAAERFLKVNFAANLDSIPALGLPAIEVVSGPEATPVAIAAPAPASTPTPSAAPVPAPVAVAPQPARPAMAPSSSDRHYDREPSWKPVAALVLSGLGVPLAYWSSSSLLQKRAPRRASLTAKGPGPRKSLPSSGA